MLARHGHQSGADVREQWERFTGLPAIRAGRLHAVDGDVLHRYGPRMVDGLEELARLLHPEAFEPRRRRRPRLRSGAPGAMTPARRSPSRWPRSPRLLLAVAALRALRRRGARVARRGARGAGRRGRRGRGPDVVLSLRLPRIAAAALAGGALAVAGRGFQALTRNPLAEPVGAGRVERRRLRRGDRPALRPRRRRSSRRSASPSFAFAGAFVAGERRVPDRRTAGGLPVHSLLLAGVIVGHLLLGSAITVLISVVDVNRLGGVIHWLLGNLAPLPPGPLAVFAALAARRRRG